MLSPIKRGHRVRNLIGTMGEEGVQLEDAGVGNPFLGIPRIVLVEKRDTKRQQRRLSIT